MPIFSRAVTNDAGLMEFSPTGNMLLDFDDIDTWEPELSNVLGDQVSESVVNQLAAARHELIEDALDHLFALTNKKMIIHKTLAWVQSRKVAGYHGTRLTHTEVKSIQAKGLLPLETRSRRSRLVRALSHHPRWNELADELDVTIERFGKGGDFGFRLNQIHLTLSRSGLINSFNHYLTHGSEFDQKVVQELLGTEGKELLRKEGEPRVIKVAVPGKAALEASQPSSSIEDILEEDKMPNLIREFLKAWSYRLADGDFQRKNLEIDCGMIFYSTVSQDWIVDIETITTC